MHSPLLDRSLPPTHPLSDATASAYIHILTRRPYCPYVDSSGMSSYLSVLHPNSFRSATHLAASGSPPHPYKSPVEANGRMPVLNTFKKFLRSILLLITIHFLKLIKPYDVYFMPLNMDLRLTDETDDNIHMRHNRYKVPYR